MHFPSHRLITINIWTIAYLVFTFVLNVLITGWLGKDILFYFPLIAIELILYALLILRMFHNKKYALSGTIFLAMGHLTVILFIAMLVDQINKNL